MEREPGEDVGHHAVAAARVGLEVDESHVAAHAEAEELDETEVDPASYPRAEAPGGDGTAHQLEVRVVSVDLRLPQHVRDD